MNLQSRYDLLTAQQSLAKDLGRIEPQRKNAA